MKPKVDGATHRYLLECADSRRPELPDFKTLCDKQISKSCNINNLQVEIGYRPEEEKMD